MNTLENICASVLSRIKPTSIEREKLQSVAKSIISRINAIGKSEGFKINAKLVGSSARRTWISGEHDLDIFIMFSPDAKREYLEEKGLYIARKVAKAAEKLEERYAEHPYIHAIFDGFEVDLVPAFNVESAAEIKSAVDRTPFHNEFVLSKIEGNEDEVLLLKQFMKGAGVYGSELKTHGFSGYLVELLVIYYGSFEKVLEASKQWKPGTLIDIEKHGNTVHDDPLIMIDPTDPARNVAAALSLDNMCIFIDRASEFLEKPDETFFQPPVIEPLGDGGFRTILEQRGTSVIALEFEAPNEVEDILFPQLHKLEGSICEMFERYDFCVYNSGVWASGKAVVLFELESAALSNVRKHTGPHVWWGTHALAFKSKYKDADTFSNVYIMKGKYMVDIPRKFTDARSLIRSEILNCSLGRQVASSVKKEYRVLEDMEILDIKVDDFRRFLRKFFEK